MPVIFGTPQGRSATFSSAQGNQSAPSLASFFVYRVSNYQVVSITNELLEATKDNAGAFVDEAKLCMDTGFRNITNDLAHDLFNAGTGTRGVMTSYTNSSTTTAMTITLATRQDIVNFEVGMKLVASTTDGGVPSTDYMTITGVNRVSGILTGTSSTAHSDDIDGKFYAGGHLTQEGDLPAAGATTTAAALKISGLAAWFPQSAPASTAFWGVDRSVDSRLYGTIFDGSSETISEALIDAASEVAMVGGQPDMCFMSFASYASLEKELGAKVQYVDVKHEEVNIAFAGIRIHAPYGAITVIPDRSCQSKTAYLLQMDTIKLRSLGKMPHVLTYGLEGLEGVRVGTADALEIRIGYYGNLICNAPCWNCNVKLSA